MLLRGVYIVGGGGFSKQVVDSFVQRGIQINGIFDDNKKGVFYHKYPIVGTIKDIHNYDLSINLFCGIGDNQTRKQIVTELNKYTFVNCIHPLSFVSDTVLMGCGNYVGPFSTLIADSRIGDHNFFNDMSLIGHDVKIGNFNHLAPHTALGGFVELGSEILVGTNATILPKIKVRDKAIIGAGAVVTQNVMEKCTVVGNPAKNLVRT
jgi:sugar O-acyltransferase (sialic acid O-acetyltransferase NeuD family)